MPISIAHGLGGKQYEPGYQISWETFLLLLITIIIFFFKTGSMPGVGLDLTTQRSRVTHSHQLSQPGTSALTFF